MMKRFVRDKYMLKWREGGNFLKIASIYLFPSIPHAYNQVQVSSCDTFVTDMLPSQALQLYATTFENYHCELI